MTNNTEAVCGAINLFGVHEAIAITSYNISANNYLKRT